MSAPYAIRIHGDPVLKQPCPDIDHIDESLVKPVQDMIVTMYDAPGVGLAGPQVGVTKRLFVYDDGDGQGARTIVNPHIVETSGTWEFEEGCLSVPGLYFPIIRPKDVHLVGQDLDGNPVEFHATDYLARIFQHETDHLDGMLLLERLDPDQKKSAMRILRQRALEEES